MRQPIRAGTPRGCNSQNAPIIASASDKNPASGKYQSAPGICANFSRTNHSASRTCPTSASTGKPTVGEMTAINAANTPTGNTKKQITGTAMRLASGPINEL